MEIQKHTGEKLEDYFSRLVAEGFEFDASYQNITLEDIESVLRRLNQFSNDKRDLFGACLIRIFLLPSLMQQAILSQMAHQSLRLGAM